MHTMVGSDDDHAVAELDGVVAGRDAALAAADDRGDEHGVLELERLERHIEKLALGAHDEFQRLGLPVSRLTFPAIWLTVRFTTLDVPQTIVPRIVRLMQRWRAAGNQVVGLQVDFDAATYQLADYAQFLQQLRQQLPPEFALGVTGLLDWAKTGDIATLNALAVDELVVQSYQGRRTVANYQDYLPALSRLRIPFKLGLVQNGKRDRQAEMQLNDSPYYRGTVVFMLNPARR